MTLSLDRNSFEEVLRAMTCKVIASSDYLGKLDSATGDGDHGVAMKRAMEAVEKGIEDCDQAGLQAMLNSVAMSVMSIDAGSTGPLMATLFMGMAGGMGDAEQVDTPVMSRMLESGLEQLQTITTARVGDKTMMDALIPGVEAFARANAASDGLPEAIEKAASAAEKGAGQTSDMEAKFGKARNIGQRSIGHQDPGATSISIMFRGLAEGIASV